MSMTVSLVVCDCRWRAMEVWGMRADKGLVLVLGCGGPKNYFRRKGLLW